MMIIAKRCLKFVEDRRSRALESSCSISPSASRITEPTSGRAIIRGRVASLLEVGTGFHPTLTRRRVLDSRGNESS